MIYQDNMRYKDFEDYLMEKFIEENPEYLDDDIPDAFANWCSEVEVDEMIERADDYAQEIVAELEKKYGTK